MKIGYARTSTLEQGAGLEAQKRDLKANCVDRVFSEQTSAVGPRKQLKAALDYLREGDALVVTKLDRLARSTKHLLDIVDDIEAKGCSLVVLDLNLDTSTATGRLLLQMLGAIGEFERALMLERQREGIQKAKKEGKYKGRKPTARAKAEEARKLIAEGVPKATVAKRLGIGRTSLYRIL